MPADNINISKPRTGFIGTGLMGMPMARQIIDAGFPLSVWNRTSEKLESLIKLGAQVDDSPAEMAGKVEVLCLCLADLDAVENVVFGKDGIIHGARPGSILVDFSSIRPDFTRDMATRLNQSNGMHWVDAPVSGGVKGVEDGSLVIMCGGEADVVNKLNKLFSCLSKNVTHFGPVGAGQVAKLCNQMIVSVTIAVIREAMCFGKCHGIDITKLPQALTGGWADSKPMQIFAPRMAKHDFEPTVAHIKTMKKDIDGAALLAHQMNLSIPVTFSAVEVYKQAASLGLLDEDVSALWKLT